MRVLKKILLAALAILLTPITYLLVSAILTYIPINEQPNELEKTESVYLNTNGIHLDIVISKENIDPQLIEGLKIFEKDRYLSFGWGDKNFYLNTPTWNDLTVKNAFTALILKSPTLIHLTRYSSIQSDWVEVKVNRNQLRKINKYLLNSFATTLGNSKILLPNKGYSTSDDFYEAIGSYSCLFNCNSWVNSGFKKSNIKACSWTPFDFGLMAMHRN